MKKPKEKGTTAQPAGGDDQKAAKTAGELEKELIQLEADRQLLFEKFQRLSADYINFQKRAPRRIAESVAYEKMAIIRSLLPSLDNFSHALASAEDARDSEGGLEGVVKGVEMVFQHLLDAIKSHGVEKVESVGKPFDPSVHEAVMQRAEPDKADGVVLEEFQAGFTLNGQVVRPAKVIVNKLSAQQHDKGDEQVNDKRADGESREGV